MVPESSETTLAPVHLIFEHIHSLNTVHQPSIDIHLTASATIPRMKRSPSETPSPPSSPTQPTTPSPKKVKTAETPTKKSSGGGGAVWTVERSAIFAERVIAAGIEHVNRDQLAEELGITKNQVKDQLAPNRSNIRKKLMDWAKGFSGSRS